MYPEIRLWSPCNLADHLGQVERLGFLSRAFEGQNLAAMLISSLLRPVKHYGEHKVVPLFGI